MRVGAVRLMVGVVLALGASRLSWGLGGLPGWRVRRSGCRSSRCRRVSQFAGLVFTGALVLATGAAHAGAHARCCSGWPPASSGTVGLAALYSGLAIGPMGVVAPIAAMSARRAGGRRASCKGSGPRRSSSSGVALALVGVALAARHRDEAGARVHPRAVALAVAAAVGLGLLFVLLDEAGGEGPAWTVLMVRVGAVSLSRSRSSCDGRRSRWTGGSSARSRGWACSTTARTCCSCSRRSVGC